MLPVLFWFCTISFTVRVFDPMYLSVRLPSVGRDRRLRIWMVCLGVTANWRLGRCGPGAGLYRVCVFGQLRLFLALGSWASQWHLEPWGTTASSGGCMGVLPEKGKVSPYKRQPLNIGVTPQLVHWKLVWFRRGKRQTSRLRAGRWQASQHRKGRSEANNPKASTRCMLEASRAGGRGWS